MKSKLDVQQTEDQRRRVFYAVRTMWPKLPWVKWTEMTNRIIESPEPCNLCACCGNACCNSRKCKKAIAAAKTYA